MTHEWLYTFPRDVSLASIRESMTWFDLAVEAENADNKFLDMKQVDIIAKDTPQDLAAWLQQRPPQAWLWTSGTVMDDHFRPKASHAKNSSK